MGKKLTQRIGSPVGTLYLFNTFGVLERDARSSGWRSVLKHPVFSYSFVI
jgi:hypothetical protein